MTRTFEVHSNTGFADCDASETLTLPRFKGPCDAVKSFVACHHPGYEFLGKVHPRAPYLHRGAAVNHATGMGLVVWVREVV